MNQFKLSINVTIEKTRFYDRKTNHSVKVKYSDNRRNRCLNKTSRQFFLWFVNL